MGFASTITPEEIEQAARENALAMIRQTIPDDLLYEVVDGRIVEKRMSARETEIASLLVEFLAPFLRMHRLGKAVAEMLFRINSETDLRRRPDVAFVSHNRWPFNRRIPKVVPWDMIPDLAVEVISESNSAYEVQKKLHDYFDAGVRRVWVVYPDQAEVYVYSSPKQVVIIGLGQELDGGDLIPGFTLPVATLFQDDPE
jgi:Uma2 family endonuclease